MSDITTRLGMVIPEGTDSAVVGVISTALEDVDENIGVMVVAQLSDIATPYAGQIAYAVDVQRFYMYTEGAWVLVAVRPANNTSTKMITLAGTTLAALTDDAGGFQVGSDSTQNLQMTGTQIQARNNNAAESLLINPLGGDVKLGLDSAATAPVMEVDTYGFVCDAMQFKENTDTTTVTVTITDWGPGGNPATINFIAPASGRVKVTATAQYETDSATDTGYYGFEITRTSNSDVFLAAGGGGKQAVIRGNQELVAVVVDIVGSMVPGREYTLKSQQKRDSGDAVTSKWRKVIVEPVF